MNLSARQILTSSFTFWVVLAGVCLFLTFPIKKHLRFGIDLVGGTYITLEVKTDKAVENELLERAQEITSYLAKNNMETPQSKTVKDNSLTLTVANPAQAQELAQNIRSEHNDLIITTEGSSVHLKFTEAREKKYKNQRRAWQHRSITRTP